jgi:hypothetical protein
MFSSKAQIRILFNCAPGFPGQRILQLSRKSPPRRLRHKPANLDARSIRMTARATI